MLAADRTSEVERKTSRLKVYGTSQLQSHRRRRTVLAPAGGQQLPPRRAPFTTIGWSGESGQARRSLDRARLRTFGVWMAGDRGPVPKWLSATAPTPAKRHR